MSTEEIALLLFALVGTGAAVALAINRVMLRRLAELRVGPLLAMIRVGS